MMERLNSSVPVYPLHPTIPNDSHSDKTMIKTRNLYRRVYIPVMKKQRKMDSRVKWWYTPSGLRSLEGDQRLLCVQI
jgi:hypothetical protein